MGKSNNSKKKKMSKKEQNPKIKKLVKKDNSVPMDIECDQKVEKGNKKKRKAKEEIRNEQKRKKEIEDAKAWELKKMDIMKSARSVVKRKILDTTEFKISFGKTKNFSKKKGNEEANKDYVKAKCLNSIENLVERCISEYRDEETYMLGFEFAQKKLTGCIDELYQKTELADGDEEEDRKAVTSEAFVKLWEGYLQKNTDGFMEKVLSNAWEWFNEWFSDKSEVMITNWFSEGKLSEQLRMHFQSLRSISKALFNDIQGSVVECIEQCLLTRSVHTSVVQYAFNEHKFIDKHKTVQQLSEYVDRCMKHYQENIDVMVAPYFAICQSSGYGKSRLVIELAKTRPLLYMSMQKFISTGYPKRTTNLVEQIFANGTINQIMLIKALGLCLNYFKEENKSPSHFESDKVYSKDQLDKVDTSWEPIKWEACEKTKKITPSNYVLLVIDEARELLDSQESGKNLFRQLRTTLYKLWAKHRIFAILVDTQSRIANFSPAIEKDPSGRGPTKVRYLLFHPYILTWTFDSMKEEKINTETVQMQIAQIRAKISPNAAEEARTAIQNVMDLNAKAANWKTVESLRKMGRPMWFWGNELTGRLKLFGVNSDTFPPSYEAALAIVFCRVGCMMSSVSDMSSDLVANHMATLLETTVTHRSQLVGYISDPYLAYCAKELWHREDFLRSYLIPAVRTAFVHGAVQRGFLGEFVARIVLLCILDAKSVKDNQHWTNVREFLKVFKKAEDVSYIPINAQMGVFHFVQYIDKIIEPDLAWLVKRRAAAMLKNNHRGADILLPYWYENEQEKVEYGYILVQVKNTQSECNLVAVFDKLKFENVFDKGDCLTKGKYANSTPRILLNLNSEATKKSVGDLQLEDTKYFFVGSKLDLYDEYLHGCKNQLYELMGASYGVEVWQNVEKNFIFAFEHRKSVKDLPQVGPVHNATSKFGLIPQQMVYEQLPHPTRAKIDQAKVVKIGAV